ncbi:hypothetical protein JCM16303_003299 [Sporobolomyces ruberrimus]
MPERPYNVQNGLPELDKPELYRASPSYRWAEATRERLWTERFAPGVPRAADWYDWALWSTCDDIIKGVHKFRSQIVEQAGSPVSPTQAVQGVIRKLFEAVEVEGSVRWNYLKRSPNLEIILNEMEEYKLF